MKILFADKLDAGRVELLKQAGHECIVEPGLSTSDLVDHLDGVEILVVRSTVVNAAAIEAGSSLGLIVRAGAGTDNVDLAAASKAGIYVSNVPGQNAIAVAELTMGLLLAIDRHIADGTTDLRAGKWNKATYTKADGLYGKTLAVIGVGDIGMAVAERAKAFGLVVAALRKDSRNAETQAQIRAVGIRLVDSLDELLAEADVVSLHVPKSPDTVGLVDAEFLAKLRDGTIILNTSRGQVVDEGALIDALDNRSMRAGLDVFANEPKSGTGKFESALARHPRVVGTHHVGASTTQAQEAVADGTIKVIEAYADGRVRNCVNISEAPPSINRIVVRHLDRVGVLAAVLAVLRSSGLNVQQMQNQVFSDLGAAVATINISGVADAATLEELSNISDVLAVSSPGPRNG